jgi:hypothetical protein
MGTRISARPLRPPFPASLHVGATTSRGSAGALARSRNRRRRDGRRPLRPMLASTLQPRARGRRHGATARGGYSARRVHPPTTAPCRARRPRAPLAAHAPAASGVARPSAPRTPRQSPTLLTGEGQAAVDALTLRGSAGGCADDPRGDRIEVLSAEVVEPTVVCAQEGTDRRRDQRARSLNGSCASMEASSTTHAAALGEKRRPREPDRRVGGAVMPVCYGIRARESSAQDAASCSQLSETSGSGTALPAPAPERWPGATRGKRPETPPPGAR